MSLLIKNGEIVTASEQYRADVYCEGEQISRIEQGIEAPADCTVIDATGKYVFPGFVDPHAHIYLPVSGTHTRDTYETASKAAVVGGTTSFIDFCIPNPGQDPLEALETWNSQSANRSACDYTYHITVTSFGKRIEQQLRKIVEQHGIKSFKVLLAYKGTVGLSDEDLYHTLRLARELDVITAAHCENADIIYGLQQKMLAEGKTGPEWHHDTHPTLVEAEGTHHLMTFAEVHDADVYVVHLSCRQALAEALRARARGVRVEIETLIQFLLLDKTYAERPNFEGAKYVMSPPLREAEHQDVLWRAIADGDIATVATDHAPFDFEGQKTMGRDDFTKIPNGIAAIEDRVNLLFTYGVKEKRISLNKLVDCASTRPAKIFGLYPRKGSIEVGSDADLVIYDPDYEGTITAASQLMNLDYNAFEGWNIRGRPCLVTVRGEIAARDGEFTGTIGRGQFLERDGHHT